MQEQNTPLVALASRLIFFLYAKPITNHTLPQQMKAITTPNGGFTLSLNESEMTKLTTLARASGKQPEDMLQDLLNTAVALRDDNLSPKDAGLLLGVSRFSVIRYFNKGLFPRAVQVNSRVIRIPRADVEQFKRDRALSCA